MSLALQIVLYVFASFVLGFLVSFFIVNSIMFKEFFKRASDEAMKAEALHDTYYDCCREEVKETTAEMEALPFERVAIESVDGLKLYAKYYNTGSKKLVLFCHGFHAIPWNCFSIIAKDLKEKGYDFLLMEQRAHWESEGEYISYGNYESKDILGWLELSKSFNVEEIVLYGVSMGATSIAFMSDLTDDERIKSAVLDCAFNSFTSLLSYLLKQRRVPKALLYGACLKSKRVAKVNFSDTTDKHLANTKIPILFLHGEDDVVVSIEDAKKNYKSCASEKELIIVPKAGHATSIAVGGEKTKKAVIDFIERHSKIDIKETV